MRVGNVARFGTRTLAAAGFLLLPCLAAAATITVTSTADNTTVDGICTLREAIGSANSNSSADCTDGEVLPTVDVIEFEITGGCPTVCTFTPTVPLTITEAVVIDGYTQTGASANTLAVGNDAVLKIEINGSSVPVVIGGIFDVAGGGSTLRGLVINRGANGNSGIRINGNNNKVEGCFIGTDATGSVDLGNIISGILFNAGTGNTIGGSTAAARNVISGNQAEGIDVTSPAGSNTIQNNYIGTTASGTAAMGNGSDGIEIILSSSNQILNNLLSGNGGRGIHLNGTTSTSNVVKGNLIGTGAAGTTAIGNTLDGLMIGNNSSSNTVGGTTVAERNLISGNGGAGIQIHGFSGNGAVGNVVLGNFIGTNAAGTGAIGNTGPGILISLGTGNQIGTSAPGAANVIAFNGSDGINSSDVSRDSFRWNSIHSNAGLGIDLLGNDGVTPNDTDDPDFGPNGLQNFPVITSVTPGVGSTTITGTLNSTALTNFHLQFFSNTACDPSGNGEGQTFLGEATPAFVSTNMGTTVPFSVTVPTVVLAGQSITATATDIGIFDKRVVKAIGGIRPMGGPVGIGATSEFSACFVVGGATPTQTPVTVTPTPTSTPSFTPTLTPSLTPSFTPTTTFTPTTGASATPTLTPSFTPTTTFTPTTGASATPTLTPTLTSTPTTTLTPTAGASATPTLTPSTTPSLTPTLMPSVTFTPSQGPSSTPTTTPSNTPIVELTPTPTSTPPVLTATPTATPTVVPPSATPTVIGGGGGPAPGDIPVPTLSEGMLALLALALAAVGYFLIRRG